MVEAFLGVTSITEQQPYDKSLKIPPAGRRKGLTKREQIGYQYLWEEVFHLDLHLSKLEIG